MVRRLLLSVAALSLAVALTAVDTKPADASVLLPSWVTQMFGSGTKAKTTDRLQNDWCAGAISAPKLGRAPAVLNGPTVDGVVVDTSLVCYGDPAYDIVMHITISRRNSIVTKFNSKRPPGGFWRYDGRSLAMRGPFSVLPDTYWGTVVIDYTLNGVRRSTGLIVSQLKYLNPGINY
jgi:hypothetical protein